MSNEQIPLFNMPFSFGPKFLQDHAGHIMTDPRIALVELMANSYDAGASLVKLSWPDAAGKNFEILDNGTGMAKSEFSKRWKTFSYNRPEEQGIYVEYPPDKKGPAKREAFGLNGKGRFSPFCFADAYEVETWKDGTTTLIRVTLTHGGTEPYRNQPCHIRE
jgi:HSP90 family molecular chaperone